MRASVRGFGLHTSGKVCHSRVRNESFWDEYRIMINLLKSYRFQWGRVKALKWWRVVRKPDPIERNDIGTILVHISVRTDIHTYTHAHTG